MIEQKWLIDANSIAWDDLKDSHGREYARYLIEHLPTVDAVEVVRCASCAYGITLQHSDYVQCKRRGRMPKNGFCSYGERRETKMDDYIKKSDVYRLFDGGYGVARIHVADIDAIPTINAESMRPVGKWVWADDGYLRCGSCRQKAPEFAHEEALETYATDFCPHCGARMEK